MQGHQCAETFCFANGFGQPLAWVNERDKAAARCRRLWATCVILPAALSIGGLRAVQAESVALLHDARVATYFSPNGGAVQARVDLIGATKTRVLVAGYGFTSDAIAQALIDAHRRGVDVKVVIDKSNLYSRHSKGPDLRAAGIDVRSHHAYAIMHHKFVVADDKVAFGSMNATDAGEARNAENWNVFSNAGPLARVYATEFFRLHAGGRPFDAQPTSAKPAPVDPSLPASEPTQS
jgi:hypothetical protein